MLLRSEARKMRRKWFKNENGQYMVEFATMFVVFVIFILGCFSVIMWGYNFNILQRGSYEASRQFAIGTYQDIPIVTNWEVGRRKVGYEIPAIKAHLMSTLGQRMMPMAMFKYSVDDIDFFLVRQKNGFPDENAHWAEYTDGNIARITINYTYGISLGIFGNIVESSPISNELYIARGNDEDWDGRDDNWEGRWANDHDNDGIIDGDTDWIDDIDDDGDSIVDYWDTGAIVRVGNDVFLWGYTWSGLPHTADTTWAVLKKMDGDRYHCQEWYRSAYWPHIIFSRPAPANANGNDAVVYITMKYDADNDGWEDCFDNWPMNADVH